MSDIYGHRRKKTTTGEIKYNDSVEGSSIEKKVADLIEGGGKIEETAPLIYTEKSEGTLPSYDIRTDRFEIAVEAKTAIERSKQAKREEVAKAEKEAKETTAETGTEE